MFSSNWLLENSALGSSSHVLAQVLCMKWQRTCSSRQVANVAYGPNARTSPAALRRLSPGPAPSEGALENVLWPLTMHREGSCFLFCISLDLENKYRRSTWGDRVFRVLAPQDSLFLSHLLTSDLQPASYVSPQACARLCLLLGRGLPDTLASPHRVVFSL